MIFVRIITVTCIVRRRLAAYEAIQAGTVHSLRHLSLQLHRTGITVRPFDVALSSCCTPGSHYSYYSRTSTCSPLSIRHRSSPTGPPPLILNRSPRNQRVPCWATGTPPQHGSVARMRRGPGIAVAVAHFAGERAADRVRDQRRDPSMRRVQSWVAREGRRSSGPWLLKKTCSTLHAPRSSLLSLFVIVGSNLTGPGPFNYPFLQFQHTPANVG